MASEFPESRGAQVTQADLSLTPEQQLLAWKSEGLHFLSDLRKQRDAGQITFETYQACAEVMAQMAAGRRQLEVLVLGHELGKGLGQ